jgi:DNA modification methylase
VIGDGDGEVKFGDCTKLMPEFPGRETVDLILTDPPYKIAANLGGKKPRGRRERRGFGANFDLHYSGGFVPFRDWLRPAAETLKPGGVIVTFESPMNLRALASAHASAGLTYNGFGVWYALGRQSNLNRRPFSSFDVWVWGSKPGKPYFYGKAPGLADVIAQPIFLGHRAGGRARPIVPGAKPVPVLRPLIRAFCPEGGLVFDPFLGSGSTGRAAREEGRRWAGCEIGAHLKETISARSLWGYRTLEVLA